MTTSVDATPGPTTLLTDVVARYLREGHEAMRELVRGLPGDVLDWNPGPDTNSITVLVLHTLDSERFLAALVARVQLARDREAAFRTTGLTADDLVAQIDAIELDVASLLAGITEDQLASPVQRGARTAPGAYWLLHLAGHAREHLGQASLTRQLAERTTR